MLLHDHCRCERGLETMGRAGADDAAKAAQRLAALLGVVRQRIQPLLDRERRAKPIDHLTLRPSEWQRRRFDPVSARER